MGQPTYLQRERPDQQGENLAVVASGRVLGWDSFLFTPKSYSNRTIPARPARPVDRQSAFFNRLGRYRNKTESSRLRMREPLVDIARQRRCGDQAMKGDADMIRRHGWTRTWGTRGVRTIGAALALAGLLAAGTIGNSDMVTAQDLA